MNTFKPKILLVNPWIVDFAAYDFWNRPLGLLSIGAVLHQAGYHVELLDCLDRAHPFYQEFFPHPTRPDGTGKFYKAYLPKPSILKNVPRRYGRYGLPLEIIKSDLSRRPIPNLIFVTSGMTYWYPGVHEMIQLLKFYFPKVPVVLGGNYPRFFSEHAKRYSGADIVAEKANEIEALHIADILTGHVSEILYRDWKDLPLPLLDLYERLEYGVLLTSLGCPFQCSFCASRILFGSYRRRPFEQILCEIERLHTQKKITRFVFYDDALLFQRESHFIPLLEEILCRNFSLQFYAPNGLHPKWIDDQVAFLLKQTGFLQLWLSVESVSPERQASMQYKVSCEEVRRAVRTLVQAGFSKDQLGAYLIMGLPDQDLNEVIESIAFVFDLGIRVSLASFSPIPFTASWNQAVQLGLLSNETDPLLTNNSVFAWYCGKMSFSTYIKLYTLVHSGNQIIRKGVNPLKDPEFHSALYQLCHS